MAATSLLIFLLFASATAGEGSPQIDPALRFVLQSPVAGRQLLLRAASEVDPPFPRAYLTDSTVRDGKLDVFLSFTGERPERLGSDWIPFEEGRVLARLTPEELKSAISHPGLSSARLSRPLQPALDQSAVYLGVDRLRQYDSESREFLGSTGKGVVIGLVDSGLDYRHPDFNSDVGTRLLGMWDQVSNGNPPPGYTFGHESSPEQLNSAFFRPPVKDVVGHGTHVLGIAAGNGRASAGISGAPGLIGVAPEASIVAVRAPLTEFHVAVGTRYIFEVAERHSMPAVVNLSLGGHSGPHDGTSDFERVLESLLGPGRLMVAAAGNSAEDELHGEIEVPAGAAVDIPVRVPHFRRGESLSFLTLEGWYSRGRRLRFSLLDPDGLIVQTWNLGDEELEGESKHGRVRGWLVNDRSWTSFLLDIVDTPLDNLWGDWTIQVQSLDEAPVEVDFWLVGWNLNGSSPRFGAHVDPEETVLSPAAARRVVAVGSVVNRSCWPDESGGQFCFSPNQAAGEVAWFSSLGPTNDGRAKPDIFAPGYAVIAPLSSVKDRTFYTESDFAALSLYQGMYWVNRGTSMAAPHVAGTAALLLEKEPTLTPEQLIQRITSRAVPGLDQRTGKAVRVLNARAAVAPPVELMDSGFTTLPDGIELRWTVDGPVPGRQFVERAPGPEGPYQVVPQSVTGGNPYTFFDPNPEPGRSNVYRVRIDDGSGLNDILVTWTTPLTAGTPQARLLPATPNPARAAATYQFSIPGSRAGEDYRLSVFDIEGRLVLRLAEGMVAAGGENRSLEWDLNASRGRVASGVYFLRLEVGPTAETQRVVVLPR